MVEDMLAELEALRKQDTNRRETDAQESAAVSALLSLEAPRVYGEFLGLFEKAARLNKIAGITMWLERSQGDRRCAQFFIRFPSKRLGGPANETTMLTIRLVSKDNAIILDSDGGGRETLPLSVDYGTVVLWRNEVGIRNATQMEEACTSILKPLLVEAMGLSEQRTATF